MCDLRKQIVMWISFTAAICNIALLGFVWHLYHDIDAAHEASKVHAQLEVASEILTDWVKEPFVSIQI